MKKIFYILVSAIVALGAVACNNEMDENIEANNGGVVSFTVALDDEASRIVIGERVDGNHPITFEEGDIIYAENSTLKAFEFVCGKDSKTFICTKPNADKVLPTEMLGKTMNFYTNKLPNSYKGADGIVLKASEQFDNVEGEVITLELGTPVLAYTATDKVTMKASKTIFVTDVPSYEKEMTVEATSEKAYIAIFNLGEVTFEYSIGGNTVKSFTLADGFENKIYNLGNLTTAVAKVNGKNYTELDKAIAAVEDGGTIELANDYVITEDNRVNLNGWYEGIYYEVEKSFTLDLGGKTINDPDNAVTDYLMLFKNVSGEAHTINIKNGTIEAGTKAFAAVCTSSTSTAQLTINLENVKISNNNPNGSAVKVRSDVGTILNVGAGTVITGEDSLLGIEASGVGTVVNIEEGVEIYQKGTSGYIGSLVGVGGNATINVYGGKGVSAKSGFIAMTSGGTINIEGGDWTANTDGTPKNGNYAVLIAQNDKNAYPNAEESIINVTGGTFKGGYHCSAVAADEAQINISGGSFNVDPTNYIADSEHYKTVLNTETSLYDVVERVPAARIEGDDTIYETVGEALKAAQTGATVVILKGEFKAASELAEKSITVKGTLGEDGTRLSTLDMSANTGTIGQTYTATTTFQDLNIKLTNDNYRGLCNAKVVYDNCAIEGTLWIYATESEFTNCVFTNTALDVYNVWFYGHDEQNYANFKDCTFNATGKSLLIYNEAVRGMNVNIENCQFISSVVDAGKTAVQMHTEQGTYGTLTIDDKTNVTGFGDINGGVWNDLNNTAKIPTDKFLKNIAGVWYVGDNAEHAAAALRSAEEEVTIKVYGDATVDVSANVATYYLGGADTKTINVEGYVYNLAKADQTPSLTFNQKNSDWNYVRMNNNDGELNLKNIAITSSGYNKGDWSRSLLRFYNKVNLENVTSGKGLTVYNDATLNKVTISDTTGTEANYSLWIVPSKVEDGVVDVTVQDCQIINLEGAGDRGITVNDYYLDAEEVSDVNLTVSGTTFKTDKKAAVLYKVNGTSDGSTLSPYELTVNWGAGNDISGVAADSENAVWVDEDSGAYFDMVVVNGCTKVAENAKATVNGVYYSSTEAAIEAAASASEPTTVNMIAGEYDSFPTDALAEAGENVTLDANGATFNGSVSLNVNGATVKNANFVNEGGNVLGGTMNGNFEGCSFTGNNAARYTYAPAEGETVYFTDCVFEGAVYGFYVDAGAGSIYFKDCEFYGFNAFGREVELVTFDNCLFGHKEGGAGYNGANLWGNTVMKNGTKFDWSAEGVSEWIQPKLSEKSYEFDGVQINTGNGYEAMTYANIETLDGDVFPEVTIDGTTFEGIAAGIVLKGGDNYLLDNKDDLLWFANEVSANGNSFNSKTVTLLADIDLAGVEWTPLGQSGTTQFEGTFDGGDKIISNLTIEDLTATAGHAVGFFGVIHNAPAQIKNVNIQTATISGLHYVAPLVGYLSGGADITDCSVTGATITANPMMPDTNLDFNGDKVGGIAGYTNDGSAISGCTVKNTYITAYRDMGGIVGCSYMGNITGNTVDTVTFTVDNSNNYDNKEVQADYNVNAIIGRNNSATVSGNTESNVTIEWGSIPAMKVNFVAPASWSGYTTAAWVWKTDADGVWYDVTDGVLSLPEEYDSVSFCAMNGAADWNNKKYQTQDMTIKNGDACGIVGTSYGVWKSEFSTEDVYLVPNSNWKEASARFAAYTFGSAEDWDNMTKVVDGVYKVAKSSFTSGNTGLIFCRMNPSATDNNWTNKWNQTGDLTIPTGANNVFVVPDGAWDGSTTGWTSVF